MSLIFVWRINILKTDPEQNPFDKLPLILKQDLDKNLCTCMDVPKREIINAIVNGAITVEEVKKQTYATMGSRCCIQQVERLIECLCASEPKKGVIGRQSKRGQPPIL